MIINKFISPESKPVLEEFLMENIPVNLYHIGDLDPFFFPSTEWYASMNNGMIEELALVYKGGVATTLLSFANSGLRQNSELLDSIAPNLPKEFYSHLSCGVAKQLKNIRVREFYGTHLKMKLNNDQLPAEIKLNGIRRLNEEDLGDILKLYNESYPENFFDKRMLATGKYFGSFDSDRLTGVAGIHVYSAEMKVAALGNIVIAEDLRGKGLCQALVTTLCGDLLKSVNVIGLNVHADNQSAINCYKKCGFDIAGKYDEYLMEVGI